MKTLHKAEVEIGHNLRNYNGVEYDRPAAFVTIETEDEELLGHLLSALSVVEALEV